MPDLNTDVQAAMAHVVSILKKDHPELEFFFVMCPFARHQMKHLSTEQRKELEKRVVHAATVTFTNYLNSPEALKV